MNAVNVGLVTFIIQHNRIQGVFLLCKITNLLIYRYVFIKHPAKCKNLAGCSTVKIYVRPQGRSPCGDVSSVVIICPCLGISFSASAESSVSPLPEAV